MDGRHESINYSCIASCLAELHAHGCELADSSQYQQQCFKWTEGRCQVSEICLVVFAVQSNDFSPCDVSMTRSPTSNCMVQVFIVKLGS
jgi:hypothetical protein